jgi:hypothetical protein
MRPRWASKPRQTDLLVVGCNFDLTNIQHQNLDPYKVKYMQNHKHYYWAENTGAICTASPEYEANVIIIYLRINEECPFKVHSSKLVISCNIINIKTVDIWDVMSCNLVHGYQHLKGINYLPSAGYTGSHPRVMWGCRLYVPPKCW